jgi:hypothetical protein
MYLGSGGGHFESVDCPLKVKATMFPEFNIEYGF